LEELRDESSDIMNIIQDPNVIQQLKQDKLQNIQFLKANYNVCIYILFFKKKKKKKKKNKIFFKLIKLILIFFG